MLEMCEEMNVGPHEKCLNVTEIIIDKHILVNLPKSDFMKTCSPVVELLLKDRPTH
jgi:hypothetical protein